MTEANRLALRALPTPEPSGGMDHYLAERERALAADPAKKSNFLRYQASQRTAKIDWLPIKLDIENVSRCNFRCGMCVVSEWDKGRRASDMTLADFQGLIDEQYGLVEIKLQGIGEPTLGADLYDMIAYARRRHIWVRTTTNASLLHHADNYRRLIDSGVNEVQISVDGADASVMQAIRRGSNFDRIIENCRLINDYCHKQGIERTKMWTVVQSANQHQMKQLVDLAHSAGFTNQVFALNLSDWGLDSWRERNNSISIQDELSVSNLLPLIDYGKELGVTVRFWTVNEKYRLDDPTKLCPWIFERAFVSSDLRVVPCCYVGNPDILQIGAAIAPGNHFRDVWHGPDYEAFRQSHIDGSPPEICRGCYADAPISH